MVSSNVVSGFNMGKENFLRDPIIATIIIATIIAILIIYYLTRKKEVRYISIQPRIYHVEEPAEVEIVKMPESLKPLAAARVGITTVREAIPSVIMQGSEESLTALYIDFKNIETEAAGRKEAHRVMMQKIDTVIEKHRGIRSLQQNKDVLVLFGEKTGTQEHELAAIRSALEICDETKRNLIKTGFGIHTGSAIMRLDFDRKLRYTPLQSTTQISSRVAERAAAGEVLISQSTYNPVSGVIQVEKTKAIEVGTKTLPLYIVKSFTKREKFKPYVDSMMRRWKQEDINKERQKIWQKTVNSTFEQLAKTEQEKKSFI
ncbi:hypothetical protein COS75_02525 [Candidatus Pacearchaeota archaeon CG06_land_8_20_14_3_00_35_12]|nr:MAG: hypothetical protein COS75_02525 [Candidatus Pacearchaeota archaeon CG06_land_8_20_14_3_00_35_12]